MEMKFYHLLSWEEHNVCFGRGCCGEHGLHRQKM